MKVKMLIKTGWGKEAGTLKPVKPNDVLEIDNSLAKQWIEQGYCEEIVDNSTKKAKKAVERKAAMKVSEDTVKKVKKNTKRTKKQVK